MKFNDFMAMKEGVATGSTRMVKETQRTVVAPPKVSTSLPPREMPLAPQKKAASLPPVATAEKNSLFTSMELLQENLNNCLKIIDDEVMKGYLTKLENLPINPIAPEELAVLKDIQFFRVTNLVYQEGEFSSYKLATMFHALESKPCTLVMMIKSDGYTNEFYLGVRSRAKEASSGTMMQLLKNTLTGLFPGSHSTPFLQEELERELKEMNIGSLSCVSCVADFRQDMAGMEDDNFTQGIEKFVTSMDGKKYHAIFIADNVGYDRLMDIKREYESIATQISPFTAMQINFAKTSSTATSSGQNQGASQSSNQNISGTRSLNLSQNYGISKTQSETLSDTVTNGTSDSTSTGESNTDGYANGDSVSKSTSLSVQIGGSVGGKLLKKISPLSVDVGYSSTFGSSQSHTESHAKTISRTLSHGISDSRSSGKSSGTSTGINKGQSLGHGLTHT